jgi:hypothetical protein
MRRKSERKSQVIFEKEKELKLNWPPM